jgi:hypothetical protein
MAEMKLEREQTEFGSLKKFRQLLLWGCPTGNDSVEMKGRYSTSVRKGGTIDKTAGALSHPFPLTICIGMTTTPSIRLKLILGGGAGTAAGILGLLDFCDNNDAAAKLTTTSAPRNGAKGLLVSFATWNWRVVYEFVLFKARLLLLLLPPPPKAVMVPLLLPPIGGFFRKGFSIADTLGDLGLEEESPKMSGFPGKLNGEDVGWVAENAILML